MEKLGHFGDKKKVWKWLDGITDEQNDMALLHA